MTRLLTALLPLLLAYTLVVIGNEWERAQLGAPEGAKIHGLGTATECGWGCHNATSSHCLGRHDGLPPAFREAIRPTYDGIVNGLHATGSYRMANLVLLAVLWPLFLSVGTMRMIRLAVRPGRWLDKAAWGVAAASAGSMVFLYEGNDLYSYLTDFTLTLGRALGWSYYDVNGMIFVVAWPAWTGVVAVGWPVLEGWRWMRRGEAEAVNGR